MTASHHPDAEGGNVFRAEPDDSMNVEVHQVSAPVAVVRRRDPVGVARFARLLRDRYGRFMPSRKRRPGRERMVQALVERCDLPRRRARAMINRLEEKGFLRFVRRERRRNGFFIETA
jgi:hypothetical protein